MRLAFLRENESDSSGDEPLPVGIVGRVIQAYEKSLARTEELTHPREEGVEEKRIMVG